MDQSEERQDSEEEMPHLDEEVDDAEMHQEVDSDGDHEEGEGLPAHLRGLVEEEEEEEEEGEVGEEEEECDDGPPVMQDSSALLDENGEEIFGGNSDDEDVEEIPPPHLDHEGGGEQFEHEAIDEAETEELAMDDQGEGEGAEDASDYEAVASRKRVASHSSNDDGPQRKQVRSSGSISGGAAAAVGQKHDQYCWNCHKEGVQAFCKICPRAYHSKCMHASDEPPKENQPVAETAIKSCICPECAIVMNAENLETRSETMRHLSVDQLILMLKYACQRMESVPGAEPFMHPVNPEDAVDYFDYIVYPMDLHTLKENVRKRQYGSTEAFLADAQWLAHNSIVYNSANSPFTMIAKKILKVCRQEIQDIETCSECYIQAHNNPDFWFVETCRRPHILVWAKLKGFPFWPAKAMRIKDDMVDVRFFGAHDRAWVVRKDCFLYSEENPTSTTPAKRNAALLTAIEELNAHVDKLKEQHGEFVFATTKTLIGPQLSVEQIRQMLPEYKPEGSSKAVAVLQTAKKSPMTMTIRISSLKTNPTIVNNSIVDEGSVSKPVVKVHKPVSSAAVTDNQKIEAEKSSVKAHPEVKDEVEADEVTADEDHISEKNEETELEPAKPTGILATALAGRPTRRSSRTEGGSSSPASMTSDSEKRVLRSVLKPSDSETGEEVIKEERESTPPPPKSFLTSLGLMKTSEVKKKPDPSTTQLGKLLHPSEVFIKNEPSGEEYHQTGGSGKTELLSHLSGTASPGMRFNLSKDISISPVGDETGEERHAQPRRLIQGHGARLVPGLIPQQMMGRVRPTGMMGASGQRMPGQGQQSRVMMRPQRPGGLPMRQPMKTMPSRPSNAQMLQMKNQGQKPKEATSTMVVDSSTLQAQGFSNAVHMNQVQSIQGAITLPGGTITVTPCHSLAPVIGITEGTLNGGQVVVKASTANGLPISVLATHDGGQSLLKSNNKPNPRRNLMNQVPASVGHLVQNLQKNLVENVKTTMEQIVVEMIEKANASGGGPEMKALKDENEKLKKQLLEYKHNHDVVVREMKDAFVADKKRAVTEHRKQLEQDKSKAVEETKKKQWCARCGREAQFYCCWNTSYCGYSCQEEHWPMHMNSCSQGSGGGGGNANARQ